MLIYNFKHHNDKDSTFYYIPNFLGKNEHDELFQYFENMNDFHNCDNYKNVSIRYQKWYQKEKKYFCPYWKDRYKRWDAFEYDETLVIIENNIKKYIKKLTLHDVAFNSILVNKYKNGDNYIHPHRDSLYSFGQYPLVVGLSLGSSRKIIFNNILYTDENKASIKKNKKNPINFTFDLEPGSIFIMLGSSQKYFSHEIPKIKCDNIRYSLTFREFLI